jgi:hypothetical protein
LKVADMPVQIAGNQQLSALLKVDNATFSTRGGPDESDGLTKIGQHPFWRRHDQLLWWNGSIVLSIFNLVTGLRPMRIRKDFVWSGHLELLGWKGSNK